MFFKTAKKLSLLVLVILLSVFLTACGGTSGDPASGSYSEYDVVIEIVEAENSEQVVEDATLTIKNFEGKEQTAGETESGLYEFKDIKLEENSAFTVNINKSGYEEKEINLTADSDIIFKNENAVELEKEGGFNTEENWIWEIEEEGDFTAEVENEFKLELPSGVAAKDSVVEVEKYSVEELPSAGDVYDMKEVYNITLEQGDTAVRSLNSDTPARFEFYTEDQIDPHKALLMHYSDGQWRIFNREIEIDNNRVTLETKDIQKLEKLAFSYFEITHGSTRSLNLKETITEEGNIIQEVEIEGIEGISAGLGESPWYRMEFTREENLIEKEAPGDFLFNNLGIQYIPPGAGKDLIFKYYGIGGIVDFKLDSGGKKILPIFYSDLLYMTLTGGDSLPFPITSEDLMTDNMKLAVDFLQYIEEEIDEVSFEFESIHNNSLKLLKWGRDKIIEYAEEEVKGDIEEKIKNLLGPWWTLIHTANRSVSSVMFAIAREDIQSFTIGTETYPEIEIRPSEVELIPGENTEFEASAYPRAESDVELTGPDWGWYIEEEGVGKLEEIGEGRAAFKVNENANPGEYTLVAGINAFVGGEMKYISKEVEIMIKEEAGENSPPSKPKLITPEDGATGVPIQPVGKWEQSSDPDGDKVVYDIYGKDEYSTFEKVVSGVEGTSYEVTNFTLDYDTVYYWKVVARDGKGGTTASDIGTFTTESGDSANIIEFEDSNLEGVIRDLINKPEGPIYKSDVEELDGTYTQFRNKGITSLEGMQYLINLQGIYLDENQITDLTPLEELTELQKLTLSNIGVDDINSLQGLTNLGYLRDLTLADNNIEDISSLANMIDLEVLNLGRNNIEDITPLANMTNLESLVLWGNNINEITSLVENEGLDSGDYIELSDNLLDLSEDSQDMQDINELKNRGVEVYY